MNILQKCTVATDKQNWMPLKVTEPGKLHIALVEDIRSGAPYAITFQGYSDGCQYVEQLKPVPISAIVCGINDRCIEGQPLQQVIMMLQELPRPFVLYFRLQDGQTQATNSNNKFIGFKATQERLKSESPRVKEITDSCIQSGSIWSFGPEHPNITATQKKAWKKLQGWEQTRKGHKRKRNAVSKGAKVGGRLSETSTHVNPDLEKDLVGCFVDKFFRGYGWWTGIITEYSDPYFNILYKDGSVETLTRKQLSKLLVYDDDVKTRAERDSYPGPHFEWAMSHETSQKGKTVIDKKNKSGSSNANGTGMIQKEEQ